MVNRKIASYFAWLVISVPLVVMAEGEITAWYISKAGDYLVKESIHGDFHAQLSLDKSGEPSVYIIVFDVDCEDDPGNLKNHDPLYVNGTLTRYSHYCDGIVRYFLPSTIAGRNHLINEFKVKKFVEIKAHDGKFRSLYSAEGFTEALKAVIIQNQGI